MSERTGMTVSQVTDEVLYKGLVEMYELSGVGGSLCKPLILQKVVLDSFLPEWPFRSQHLYLYKPVGWWYK